MGDDFRDEPESELLSKFPSFFECLARGIGGPPKYMKDGSVEYPELQDQNLPETYKFLNTTELPKADEEPGAGPSSTRSAEDPRSSVAAADEKTNIAFPRYVFLPRFEDPKDSGGKEKEGKERPGLPAPGNKVKALYLTPAASRVQLLSNNGLDFEECDWYYVQAQKLVGPHSMFALRERAFRGEIPWGMALKTKNSSWTFLQPDHHSSDRRRLMHDSDDFSKWVTGKLEVESERHRIKEKRATAASLRPELVHGYVRKSMHKSILKECEGALDALKKEVLGSLPEKYPSLPLQPLAHEVKVAIPEAADPAPKRGRDQGVQNLQIRRFRILPRWEMVQSRVRTNPPSSKPEPKKKEEPKEPKTEPKKEPKKEPKTEPHPHVKAEKTSSKSSLPPTKKENAATGEKKQKNKGVAKKELTGKEKARMGRRRRLAR